MAIFEGVKAVLRGKKIQLNQWIQCQNIQFRNPTMTMISPVIWSYDDINAISIGSNIFIDAFSEIVVLKHSRLSPIEGCLNIEDNVVIGSSANIRAGGGEIHIKRKALLAQRVSLIAANHLIYANNFYQDLPWDSAKTGVYIGENVWIGAGVTILPGCVVGENSVVGAGSIVTKNIPPNEVWAGVPARKLRDVTSLNELKVHTSVELH